MKSIMKLLLALYPGKIADMISEEIKSGISPLAPFLRRLSLGVVIILLSGVAWLIGLVGFVVTFFFYLSDLSQFTYPGLYTSLASWVVAGLMVFIGLRFLKKPR